MAINMSAVARLRLRLGPTQGTVVRAFFELGAVSALLKLHEAVATMAKATCIGFVDDGSDLERFPTESDICSGQHHAKDCPVVLARRAVLDLSGEIEGMP